MLASDLFRRSVRTPLRGSSRVGDSGHGVLFWYVESLTGQVADFLAA